MTVYAKIELEAPEWRLQHCLEACEGFRVKRGGRFIGFVESVRRDDDRAVELVVEVGSAQPRHVIVPVDDIAEIEPDIDRIELRAVPPGTIERYADAER